MFEDSLYNGQLLEITEDGKMQLEIDSDEFQKVQLDFKSYMQRKENNEAHNDDSNIIEVFKQEKPEISSKYYLSYFHQNDDEIACSSAHCHFVKKINKHRMYKNTDRSQ